LTQKSVGFDQYPGEVKSPRPGALLQKQLQEGTWCTNWSLSWGSQIPSSSSAG